MDGVDNIRLPIYFLLLYYEAVYNRDNSHVVRSSRTSQGSTSYIFLMSAAHVLLQDFFRELNQRCNDRMGFF